ncbi:MAG: xylulokinase [Clostridiales bacterium]|jgi:xylulokinase|nr:xylulokinase [Clostridiales bacterium]
MAYLLGIDIGTSGTKTVLFDERGNTVASALGEYPLYQPQIGWAEQEPEDWWKATVDTIRQVLAKSGVNPADIKGIGLSGQMHGMVLLDKDGKVIRSSIIWCDQRTQEECDQITEIIGRDRLIEITANPALTGFTASKVMWVKNHQPEYFERINKILLPKDYIRYRLTGEFATEVSDASGMQFLDVPNRRWSHEILDRLGIERQWMPEVYESQVISGKVTQQAAQITGLMPGTPVVGGGGDQAAGAVGNGIVKSGVISSTIGTSGVVFAHMDEVSIDPQGRVHTFCHAVPNAWHVMGVTQGAGLSLQWMRNNFGGAERELAKFLDIDPYVLMDAQAEKAAPGCEGLIYLPYMMGERTPHLDPYARGVFFGISAKHGRNEMIRAVMEGVAYSLRDCLEIIKSMGVPVSEVRASGGGGKSKLWRQMQADVFNNPITTINSTEGPALGVALLAGVGAGIYSSVAEACEVAIKTVSVQQPIVENVRVYDRYYQVYKELYYALKDSYLKVAEIGRDLGKEES